MRLLLPCKCRDRGEEDFWNLLPAHPLLLYLPTCLTTYTTHTLINEETGDPCPSPWRKEGHALQRLHMSHPTPPCPALEQVWWPSPSTFYKYKGRLQDKGGGQNFGEGEKQTIDSRGEYAEKKERKKRAVTEETERERQRIVWREIRWQKQREEEERPQLAAATPTPPGAQTQQHCPCHSQPSSAHHLPPTRCCTIEEKAATCASARGRRRRKPLLSSGFPATATFIITVRHRRIPLHIHQHHRQLSLPSQSTTAPWEAEGRNENRGEQSWRKTQRRRGRKADHRPRHSPGRRHQHLHEAAAEREERCWQREQRKQRKKSSAETAGRRKKAAATPLPNRPPAPPSAHLSRLIIRGNSSLITFGCSSSCMQNVHSARSASKKLISWLLCRCTVTSLCSFRAGTSAQPMQPGWVQPCRK